MSEDATVGRVVLNTLLEKMDVKSAIVVRRATATKPNENAPYILDVTEGGDLTRLIGKRGDTLAALQYITRLVTSRELQRRANVIVDVDGYKARRANMLKGLAQRMADQAIEKERIVTLEPMPPHERRIIHLALRDREDVETRSVGEGVGRKVTIVPKSQAQ
jgi:spoIIIJ-associated protein